MTSRATRRYRSTLREEQAEATALRIVEAAIRVLERAPADLSIPAVAREARVAVPTVYRHFGDKAGLIRAIAEHLDRVLADELPEPETPAELAEHVLAAFSSLDGRHALMAPALRSPEGVAFRREQLAERARMVRAALSEASSRLDGGDTEHLVSIVTALCTSETLGLLQEYLGLSAEEAGTAVAWAITRISEEHSA